MLKSSRDTLAHHGNSGRLHVDGEHGLVGRAQRGANEVASRRIVHEDLGIDSPGTYDDLGLLGQAARACVHVNAVVQFQVLQKMCGCKVSDKCPVSGSG
jgi:hypothetical protein